MKDPINEPLRSEQVHSPGYGRTPRKVPSEMTLGMPSATDTVIDEDNEARRDNHTRRVGIHVRLASTRGITHSAISCIFRYTDGSLIHMEQGGIQPPLLCSSTSSRGVKISGTM